MQKSFIKSFAWLQGLNFLIKPIWIFGMDRLAQVQMGDELYGKYAVIFTFCLLFNILLDLGLNNFVASKVASNQQLNLNQILRWRLLMALVYAGLVFLLSHWQSWGLALVLLAISNQILASLVLYFRAILQGKHLFIYDAIVSVSDRTIAIIAGIIYLFFASFAGAQGIFIFFAIQTIGYLGAFILAFTLTRFPSSQAPTHSFKSIWPQVQWFAILALVMSVFTRVDTYMLGQFSQGSFTDAGIYAKGFRLLDAALIFSGLLSTMLLPMFSKFFSQQQNTASTISFSNRIILTVSVPMVLLATYYAPAIMHLLYPSHTGAGLATFSLVVSAFLPMALVHVFGTFLSATGYNKWVSAFAVVCMVINIALNLWLIPLHAHYGAAIACIVTQSIFAFCCIIACRILNAFTWDSLKLYKIVLFVFLSFLIFNLFGSLHPTIIWGISLAMVSGILGVFMLFPSLRQVKSFFIKD